MTMRLFRQLRRFLLPSIVEEGGGAPALEAPQVEATATPAETAESAKPSSLLDAMFGATPEAPEAPATTGQPRDPHGRFTKADGTPADPVAPKPAAELAPKPAEQKPPTGEDLRKMPEGLKPESQQRFQALANANKEFEAKTAELTGQVETLTQQVSYIRETFHEHGITQQQFEQAAGFIGAINAGRYEDAQRILAAQMQQLALATGKPMPGVDALSDFPDLRQEVDQGVMSEARALELARHRLGQQAVQSRFTAEREQQQQQQATEQAKAAGLKDVDGFCKQMQGQDPDYPAIEEKLLPQLKDLLDGVPPNLWGAKVQAAYRLIKSTAGSARPAAAPAAPILRPTGSHSPASQPKTMFDAMWAK